MSGGRRFLETLACFGMILALTVSASFGQDEGVDSAVALDDFEASQGWGFGGGFEPVGAWSFNAMDLDGNYLFNVLGVFNLGGTTAQAANNGPEITGFGTWKKTGRRRLRFSQYLALFDPDHRSPDRQWFDDGVHVGHVLVIGDLRMEDRNTMSGTAEIFILLGTDPLRPESSFSAGRQLLFGERLPLSPPE